MQTFKKRVLSTLLTLALTLSLVGPGLTASAASAAKEIDLFGIGDFGGALDDSGKPTGNPGGARVVGGMKALTAESKNAIVLSGGTIYTGSAISEINHGKPVNEMLKAMGTKYATVGNHDFDWSTMDTREQCFADWQAEGGFTFLNANVYYTEGPNAGKRVFTPYAVEEVDGVKIGFFGVINEASIASISAVNTEGIELRGTVEAGIEMVNTLRTDEKCDVVIALAHIGGGQDAPYTEKQPVTGPMADFITGVNAGVGKNVRGLDGVMGSQTTDPMCGVVDGTPVVKAQNYGRIIDQLKIEVSSSGKVTVTPSLHPLTQLVVDEKDVLGSDENTRANTPEDPDFKKVYEGYNDALTALMDAQRGTSDAAFSYDGEANQFAYQKWYLRMNYEYLNNVYGEHVDAYFQNTGGIRNIGSTVVNVGDPIALRLLYTVAPFDNYIVTMDMKGSDIKALLSGKSQYGEYASLKQYGLDVTYAAGEYEANGEVVSVQLNGQDLADDQTYRIACNTFLYPGPGDNMDFSAGTDPNYTNVLNRNAVLYALLDRSATLDKLEVQSGTLSPAFAPNVTGYTLDVSGDFSADQMAFQAHDPLAEVSVNDAADPATGARTITLTVTSAYENPHTTPATVSKTYTITLDHAFTDQADIPAWAVDAVKAMSAKGYFQGDASGAFHGELPLTREMAVTVLARVGGAQGGGSAEGVFADQVSAWAAPSAAWCASKGIVEGNGATFNGGDAVTYEQFSAMLGALAREMGVEMPQLQAPQGGMDRCQAAVMLDQFVQSVEQ